MVLLLLHIRNSYFRKVIDMDWEHAVPTEPQSPQSPVQRVRWPRDLPQEVCYRAHRWRALTNGWNAISRPLWCAIIAARTSLPSSSTDGNSSGGYGGYCGAAAAAASSSAAAVGAAAAAAAAAWRHGQMTSWFSGSFNWLSCRCRAAATLRLLFVVGLLAVVDRWPTTVGYGYMALAMAIWLWFGIMPAEYGNCAATPTRTWIAWREGERGAWLGSSVARQLGSLVACILIARALILKNERVSH